MKTAEEWVALTDLMNVQCTEDYVEQIRDIQRDARAEVAARLRVLVDAAMDYLKWQGKHEDMTSTVLRVAIKQAREVL